MASSRSLALISTDAYATDLLVRDVTDVDHPFTVSNLTHKVSPAAKFVDAAELSGPSDGPGLVRMPLSGSPTTLVTACNPGRFAWSPDGSEAAYIVGTANPKVQALHLVANGVDRVVDSMPAFDSAVGCESRGPGCWETWEISLLFAPSGNYISYIEQLGGFSVFRIWTASGKVLKAVDGSSATMQSWSGSTLYWRDDAGVESWRDGVEALALPGLRWVRPNVSPASGQIVFVTLDAGSTAHIQLLDTRTKQIRNITSSRSEPAFLNSRYLWYIGDKPCCDPQRDGQYVYDLQTATESPSSITQLWDVWPHPA